MSSASPLAARLKPRLSALITRSFLVSSLIPLLTIELVLLLLYFGINAFIEDNSRRTLRAELTDNMSHLVDGVTGQIDVQTRHVAQAAKMLAEVTEFFYAHPDWQPPASLEAARLEIAANGAMFKANDNGGSSLFYSRKDRYTDEERTKASRSEVLDPVYRAMQRSSKDVVAVYFNTWDGMNRYYPFIPDVFNQYTPVLAMQDFNFYYLADAAHDPARKPVWTGVYLDPAGKGWMTSCVAPVYRGDVLEGVLGLDLTTQDIVRNILGLKLPWKAQAFLTDAEGTILAMPPELRQRLGLDAEGSGYSGKPIQTEVLQPGELHLNKLPDPVAAASFKAVLASQETAHEVALSRGSLIVFKGVVPETGWQVFIAADEATVFAPIYELAQASRRVGLAAIAVMLVFYVAFFFYLRRRGAEVAQRIASPVAALTEATGQITSGKPGAALPEAGIEELDTLSANFAQMRRDLEATRRKQAEALEAAETASRAKTEFLANMSHEIRTPLNGVMGMAQLLQFSRLDEKQQRQVDILLEAARGLLSLVNDVLDLSKVEAGHLAFEDRPFDATQLTRDLGDLFGAQARAKGLAFTLSLPELLPWHVRGDTFRVRQVISNLLNNAIKFTERGQVTLALEAVPEGDTQVRLTFAVTDTGIGIPKDRQEAIFERFVQADGSMTRRFGGSGLGLTLSRHLASLMGGTVTVESQHGRGSTFRFSVPFPLAQTESASSGAAAELRPPSGMRVLIAEDNDVNRDYLEQVLRHYGLAVVSARDGQQAVEAWEAQPVDLVLMDCQMPTMDGMEATRLLRELEATRPGRQRVPVLALTAHAHPSFAERCRDAGMDEVLHKPIEPEQLLKALKRWLPERP